MSDDLAACLRHCKSMNLMDLEEFQNNVGKDTCTFLVLCIQRSNGSITPPPVISIGVHMVISDFCNKYSTSRIQPWNLRSVVSSDAKTEDNGE